MCGILFVSKLDGGEAHKSIAKRYRNQKSRGTQGYGYVAIGKDGTIERVARALDEEGIMTELKKETAGTILFHHRMPTGGVENYIEVTHPFYISDKRFNHDYYVVHNGVIQNWESLYEKYKKDNYTFLTEMHESSKVKFVNHQDVEWEFDTKIKINDSEALSLDLARYFEGMQTEIESRGTIAFVALQIDKKTNKLVHVIYGHNDGNPLKLEEDKTLFALRSMGKTESKDVTVNEISYLDWQTKTITTEKQPIGSYFPRPQHHGGHGGRGTGFDSSKITRPAPSDSMIAAMRRRNQSTIRRSERVLDPTHPILSLPVGKRPITNDMATSLDDMDAAMKRSMDNDTVNDDSYGLTETERLAFGGPRTPEDFARGKDDERYASFLDNDDDGNYSVSDFEADDETRSFLKDELADVEIDEIYATLANNDSNSDEARELRKDLRKALYDAQGAATELSDAKLLLRSVAADFQKDKATIEDCEESKSLVDAAEQQLKGCFREINNINAELSAWN